MMEPVKATAKKAADSLNGQNPVVKIIRTVMLAAIGAVALSKEEIESIVNRLIEKGEIAESDGRELIGDLLERRKKEEVEVSEEAEKVGGVVDQRVESILNRMNIPSKGDVESLSRKIGSLSQKVDDRSCANFVASFSISNSLASGIWSQRSSRNKQNSVKTFLSLPNRATRFALTPSLWLRVWSLFACKCRTKL